LGNIAELIVDTLIAAGVKRVYGVTGDSLNGITDTIRKRKEIKWIPVRHEETAAFAAGAEAHLTGSLTVCAGSCGPGNLHLINGLYDCYRNRVPVLAIAAHIPTSEIGGNYFQETHPEKIFQECTKFCEQVSSPEQMPRVLDIAIQTAISLQSVSMVIISGDVSMKPAVSPPSTRLLSAERSTIRPSEKNLEQAAEVLNRSEKTAILGGAGCAGAHKELVQVADRLKAPIVHTLRGKEYIEYDNPFDVGMTGLLGFSSGYHAMAGCDTLLILGADFPYRQFFPEKATVIQVDCRQENIGRRCQVDYGLVGDVKETLSVLLNKLQEKKGRKFLDAAKDHYHEARSDLNDLAVGTPGKKPIHPQYVTKLVSDLATSDAIFSCDVGTPTIWAARYLKMNGKRALLGSFNHGSMANALPQAIGAQAAFPKRQVISLSGDGGLAMLMGELLTLKQIQAPVKVIVFNNGAYGFVELEMKAVGLLEFATDLTNPNFAKMAEAIGLLGIRVETPEEVEGALKQALDFDGPALIDVVVSRQELSMPPKIDLQQVVGFNLWMMKAVMNGKGNEVIDLIKTNLFR
jgi:pyruvate dehydrogenase (quinone)